jgi:hypothetical protein
MPERITLAALRDHDGDLWIEVPGWPGKFEVIQFIPDGLSRDRAAIEREYGPITGTGTVTIDV